MDTVGMILIILILVGVTGYFLYRSYQQEQNKQSIEGCIGTIWCTESQGVIARLCEQEGIQIHPPREIKPLKDGYYQATMNETWPGSWPLRGGKDAVPIRVAIMTEGSSHPCIIPGKSDGPNNALSPVVVEGLRNEAAIKMMATFLSRGMERLEEIVDNIKRIANIRLVTYLMIGVLILLAVILFLHFKDAQTMTKLSTFLSQYGY